MPADPYTHSLTTHSEHLAAACERTEKDDREVTQLRAENHALRQDNVGLAARINHQSADYEMLQHQSNSQVGTIAELRAEVDSLRSQIARENWIEGNDALRKENERLRGECKRLASDSDQFGRCLGDTVTRLQAAHQELDSLRSQLTASQAEVEQLTRWLADSREEVERLRGIEAALIARWQQKFANQDATIANLSAREAETAKRCEAVVAAVEGLREDRQSIKFGYGGWTGIQEYRLSTLRQAVDALRTTTATEVRA